MQEGQCHGGGGEDTHKLTGCSPECREDQSWIRTHFRSGKAGDTKISWIHFKNCSSGIILPKRH